MEDNFDYGALTEQTDDEGLQTAYGVKPYDGRNFYVTLRLSDLYNAVITEHDYEDGRQPQRGIFVPFRDAGLTVTPKKNVLLVCKAELAQVASAHHSHLLTQVVDRDIAVEHRRLGYKEGFIGFARPVGSKKKK
jgi:hypothetical protein